MTNMSFNASRENKILAKISEFSVAPSGHTGVPALSCNLTTVEPSLIACRDTDQLHLDGNRMPEYL